MHLINVKHLHGNKNNFKIKYKIRRQLEKNELLSIKQDRSETKPFHHDLKPSASLSIMNKGRKSPVAVDRWITALTWRVDYASVSENAQYNYNCITLYEAEPLRDCILDC